MDSVICSLGTTIRTAGSQEAFRHNMHVPSPCNADVDFRTHMIPRHQGAVEMAKVALKHAEDPGTKRMAQKISDDQEKGIAEMQDWLKKNGK